MMKKGFFRWFVLFLVFGFLTPVLIWFYNKYVKKTDSVTNQKELEDVYNSSVIAFESSNYDKSIEIRELAENVYIGVKGVGTSNFVYGSITELISNQDEWDYLKGVFGFRAGSWYDFGGGEWNLKQWLQDDLGVDYQKLETHLGSRGITL